LLSIMEGEWLSRVTIPKPCLDAQNAMRGNTKKAMLYSGVQFGQHRARHARNYALNTGSDTRRQYVGNRNDNIHGNMCRGYLANCWRNAK